MINLLIFLAVYIIGVLASIVLIAWVNASDSDRDVPFGACALSWLMVITFIVLLIALPLKMFYDGCYKYFTKRNDYEY